MLLDCDAPHRERTGATGLRDLDEAVMWLDSDSCIGPVDVLVDLAAWRLDTIREALRDEEANTVTAMTHQMARSQ